MPSAQCTAGRGRCRTARLDLLNYLAWDYSVFIVRVDRAQSMIAIGNDDSSVAWISYQEEWRKRICRFNFSLIFFDMSIAYSEQRQTGGSENILRFELRYRCASEFFHTSRSCRLIIEQVQIR